MKKGIYVAGLAVVSVLAVLGLTVATAHAEGEILQGGNAFNSNIVVGANDNYGLSFVTANVTRATISNTGTASFNGSVVLGGSANRRVTVNGQITGATPFIFQGGSEDPFSTSFAVADPTANNVITLPNASGMICLSSGNCGAGGDINQGGNAFAANLSIGTQDNFVFSLKANNIDRLSITPSGEVTYKAHLVSGNPTSAATPILILPFAGTGSLATLAGNDTAGTITIKTGKNPAANFLAIVGFSSRYAHTPHIVLSPSNRAAASINGYTDYANPTGFALGAGVTPAPDTTYSFSYHITQ